MRRLGFLSWTPSNILKPLDKKSRLKGGRPKKKDEKMLNFKSNPKEELTDKIIAREILAIKRKLTEDRT